MSLNKKIILSIIIAILTLLTSLFIFAMWLLGGFQTLPKENPISEIKIISKSNIIDTNNHNFSVAILGDMRWDESPRIGVLQHAQKQNPTFMINLADATDYARKEEWEVYAKELQEQWNKKIPYFHIPGGHSQNIRINGIKPYFYKYYFGRQYYFVDINNWRFIFLNSGLGYFNKTQLKWLTKTLENAKQDNKNIVLSMHYPPYDEKNGITHALWKYSTNKLRNTIKEYNIKAILTAHIHKMVDYTWNGIPVYITALNEQSWGDVPVAPYRFAEFSKDGFKIKTINVKNQTKSNK